MFLVKVMKAVAVILLLAFCGAASAKLMPRQAECVITDTAAVADMATRCASATSLCSDECAGFRCNYYKTNNFPSSCVTAQATLCQAAGPSVPAACGAAASTGNPSTSTSTPSTGTPSTSGAAALSAIKGLLVAVLLLAALIVA